MKTYDCLCFDGENVIISEQKSSFYMVTVSVRKFTTLPKQRYEIIDISCKKFNYFYTQLARYEDWLVTNSLIKFLVKI